MRLCPTKVGDSSPDGDAEAPQAAWEGQDMSPEGINPDASAEMHRYQPLPESWLYEPVDLPAIEDELASENLPDQWLLQWRSFRNRMQAGDEVWEHFAFESGPEDSVWECYEGYALVRDGRIIAHIGLPP
jgi:hypothetical protein